MTETQNSDIRVVPGKGLTMERLYTTAGVHPYDEVTWERRDVVQPNWKTGETVFEQHGVEFPDFWSVNASTIVTTKYFRGALGSDVREWSLRQLLDRVVLTYVRAGKEHGYFATDDDATIFEHELTWMLLHQVFSFNSPVWFNVGTASPAAGVRVLHPRRRRHDGLDPELVPRGGPDLQGRLRRGPEPVPDPLLQGAAVQRRYGVSGPVSLHARRGRLRRHHQERRRHPAGGQDGRARRGPPRHRGVRRDQGARGAQDPRAARRRVRHGPRRARHHQRAVPERQQLRPRHRRVHAARSRTAPSSACKARHTGEVIETVDARELFRKIAQAAWECADPGIQYDGTINDWHTNPETGRITASNPCSEYMSPGQLLLQPGEPEPAQVPARTTTRSTPTKFAKAVEFIITAMDISICFADFPTEPIGETTRAYRQLGIGYANLGALLMATGLPYDSDGGRALAAAITSLMTGTAYKRSRPSWPAWSGRTRASPATPRRTPG